MNGELLFSTIVKRNGEQVPFSASKIEHAIFKAMRSLGKPNRKQAYNLCQLVLKMLSDICPDCKPTVEQVQDCVEQTLFSYGEFDLLKAYMLYRNQHAQIRDAKELFSNIEVMDN